MFVNLAESHAVISGDRGFRRRKIVETTRRYVESFSFSGAQLVARINWYGQRWQIARRLLTPNYGILPLLSRRNTRFRDNRRLTMTLPLVTIARSRYQLPRATRTPSFSPVPNRSAIYQRRRPTVFCDCDIPLGDYHRPGASPWIFQNPNELIISVCPARHPLRMIIRGYDNVPWITDALSTRDTKRSAFQCVSPTTRDEVNCSLARSTAKLKSCRSRRGGSLTPERQFSVSVLINTRE